MQQYVIVGIKIMWHRYFIDMLPLVAAKSKDIHTQVGVIFVDPYNHTIRSTGFNSIPHGVEDKPERYERPIKYEWIEHAERSAIDIAAKNGIKLYNSIVYLPILPCHDCTKGLVNLEVNSIVLDSTTFIDYHTKNKERDNYWTDLEYTKIMLQESGIPILSFLPNNTIINFNWFEKGKIF